MDPRDQADSQWQLHYTAPVPRPPAYSMWVNRHVLRLLDLSGIDIVDYTGSRSSGGHAHAFAQRFYKAHGSILGNAR